jgi:hypothetical protein
MVSHNGSLYQARRGTAQPPGGSDWVCVARHGRDAITPTVRGNYDVHECYAKLEIVKTAIEDERQALAAKLVELQQGRMSGGPQSICTSTARANPCSNGLARCSGSFALS